MVDVNHSNTFTGESKMKLKNCPMCAEEILEAARKCKHCGEMIITESGVNTQTVHLAPGNSDEIRANLRPYSKHISRMCLDCGYEGLMGVTDTRVPWYLTFWIIVPVICTGIGIIPAICLFVWRDFATVQEVRCPACSAYLIAESE